MNKKKFDEAQMIQGELCGEKNRLETLNKIGNGSPGIAASEIKISGNGNSVVLTESEGKKILTILKKATTKKMKELERQFDNL